VVFVGNGGFIPDDYHACNSSFISKRRFERDLFSYIEHHGVSLYTICLNPRTTEGRVPRKRRVCSVRVGLGPHYPLGTIDTVPRVYDIFKAYEVMEGRKKRKKNENLM
jgi:hypothetical protein